MTNVFRTSIAARSAAVILAIVGVAGLAFLALAVSLTERQETANQQARLNELLDTVQRTVSIACFLSDKQLANEVAHGLLSNRTVSEVTVSAGSAILARRGKAAETLADSTASASRPGTLVRAISSPFNPAEIVGEIALVPDAGEIRNSVLNASALAALLVIGQVIVIGLGVVAVVIGFITRPIARISARLHELRAETGQKLEVPRGNETDEIGQLVRDVNTMADYLVNILNEERCLRVEREIGEKKFRAIFEHAHTGIFVIDKGGVLISYNPACAQWFGIPEEAGAGNALPRLTDLIGNERTQVSMLISRAVADNESVGQDMKLDGHAGAPSRWVNIVLTPIEGLRLQGVVNDITEQKEAEKAAQELAATDRLTGIGNRLAFDRKLEQMINAACRHPDRRFTLLMLDLDWFKQVNDSHGHRAGDQMLIKVARALEGAVRKTDFVGRFGGDEFVVLLDSTFQREMIEPIIRKIIRDINRPLSIGAGQAATIGASVGAAIFEGDITTKDRLVRAADEAMYEAKQNGRNTYRFADTVSA